MGRGERSCEHFQGGVPRVSGARAVVHAVGNRVEFVLAEHAQVGALGQVLAQQSVGVLAGAALPRTVWVTKSLLPGFSFAALMTSCRVL
jgi:hypothetical protein